MKYPAPVFPSIDDQQRWIAQHGVSPSEAPDPKDLPPPPRGPLRLSTLMAADAQMSTTLILQSADEQFWTWEGDIVLGQEDGIWQWTDGTWTFTLAKEAQRLQDMHAEASGNGVDRNVKLQIVTVILEPGQILVLDAERCVHMGRRMHNISLSELPAVVYRIVSVRVPSCPTWFDTQNSVNPCGNAAFYELPLQVHNTPGVISTLVFLHALPINNLDLYFVF